MSAVASTGSTALATVCFAVLRIWWRWHFLMVRKSGGQSEWQLLGIPPWGTSRPGTKDSDDANSIGEYFCFFKWHCMYYKYLSWMIYGVSWLHSRAQHSSMGWRSSPSGTLHSWTRKMKTRQSTTCRDHLQNGILTLPSEKKYSTLHPSSIFLISTAPFSLHYIASCCFHCIKANPGQALKGSRPSPRVPERCHLTSTSMLGYWWVVHSLSFHLITCQNHMSWWRDQAPWSQVCALWHPFQATSLDQAGLENALIIQSMTSLNIS